MLLMIIVKQKSSNKRMEDSFMKESIQDEIEAYIKRAISDIARKCHVKEQIIIIQIKKVLAT